MFVYVLNKNGEPLMPTKRFGKVRRMLKNKQAKVIKRSPFTVQLLYQIDNPIVQDISLGVDAGSKHIGLSATTEKYELYAEDVELRNDIVKNISTKLVKRDTESLVSTIGNAMKNGLLRVFAKKMKHT